MAKKKKEKSTKAHASKAYNPRKQVNIIIEAGLDFEKGFWGEHLLPVLLIFLLSIGLYAASVNYGFVLDDKIVYSENDFVSKGFGGIKDIFSTESFTGYFGEQKDLIEGGRYRPLSLASFAVEFALFKVPGKDKNGQDGWVGNPFVGHLINILLYGLTGVLLFRILFLLFPLGEGRPWYLGLAFIAALLFVLHPVHSEAVANIKGRDEIMALLGALGALYYSLAYFQKNNFLYVGLAMFSFLLGVFAKENALTFIAIIPLTAYCFTKTDWRRIINLTAALFGVALFYLFVRTQVIGFLLNPGREITDIMNNPFAGLNVGEKFATIFYTLGQYLKLLVVPHPLTHDYYPYHVPIMNFGNIGALLPLLLHLALGVYAVWGILKKDLVAYGILFYLLTLSIVSNVPFTVGTFMNERFIYMPSIGFCLIMAWLITKKLPALKMDILAYGLLGFMVLGFAVKTFTRVPAWESALSLNSAAIKVSKNSARANCFMGTALFDIYKGETDATRKNDLLDQVDFYINRSLEIYPNYFSANTMKSGVIAEIYKRDHDLDKLLNGFYEVLMVKSNLPFVSEYMEYLKTREDRNKILDWCHRVGMGFTQKGNWNTALKWLDFGLGIAPGNKQMLQDIGTVYQTSGNPNKAQEYFNRAQ